MLKKAVPILAVFFLFFLFFWLVTPLQVNAAGYGDSCTTDSDCIGCLTCEQSGAWGSGPLLCTNGDWNGLCAAQGKTCGTDGACHAVPTPTPTPLPCTLYGQGCNDDPDCCSNVCNQVTGVCDMPILPTNTPTPTPSCLSENQICGYTGARPCCSGLSCQDTPSGVDKCKPSGATPTSTPPPDCLGTYTCGNGPGTDYYTSDNTCGPIGSCGAGKRRTGYDNCVSSLGTRCPTYTVRDYCQTDSSCIGVPTATPTPGGPTNTPGPTTSPLPTTPPPPAGYNAACVSNTLPTTVNPGQSFTATVKMRNTGTGYWAGGGANPDGISSVPFGSAVWGSSGVALPAGTIINQNQEYEFTLNLTAPGAGTYDSFWKMVHIGALFGAQCGRSITVVDSCPWDIIKTGTSNGKVDQDDLNKLNTCYNPLGGVGAGCQIADLSNAKGVVNALDYSILLAHWGNCP